MESTRRHWKAIVLAACFTLVSSAIAADMCVPAKTALGGSATRASDHDAEGNKAAARLTARYLDRQLDCGGPSEPLFLCSAVMLRGVARDADRYDSGLSFQPWMPNRRQSTVDREKPAHPAGVSTSIMRADFQFKALAYYYTAGFFFYPARDRPSDTTPLTVICAYPIDAATNERGHITYPFNTGCIRHYNFDPVSGPCNDTEKAHPGQAIDTPEEWLAQYGKGTQSIDAHRRQCAFLLLDVTPKWEDESWDLVRTELNADKAAPPYGAHAAVDFLDMVQVMHAINATDAKDPKNGESFNTQNELMVQAWDVVPSASTAAGSAAYADKAGQFEKQAPIEAFWYLAGHGQGLTNAKVMQKSFKERTGVWLPVIRFTLAPSLEQRASFAYLPADQTP